MNEKRCIASNFEEDADSTIARLETKKEIQKPKDISAVKLSLYFESMSTIFSTIDST